jgi:hypothetical protein
MHIHTKTNPVGKCDMKLKRKRKDMGCIECGKDNIVEILERGDLVCKDCGVVQRSRLAFTGQGWSNEATTNIETETSGNVVHETTCGVIDSICERLELDSSVCSQAKEELNMFYKVRICTLFHHFVTLYLIAMWMAVLD